jgi:hypothetical protein
MELSGCSSLFRLVRRPIERLIRLGDIKYLAKRRGPTHAFVTTDSHGPEFREGLETKPCPSTGSFQLFC